MVPDKFNMVDMGGIDLIMMQGESVPGLYEKLMAAISNCRYQCLYNWLFDGVLIPPTYVQLEDIDGEVYLNEGVSVTSDDVIHIYSIEPAPVEPEIIPLLAEENGTYTAPSGIDGYSPVVVNVPASIPTQYASLIKEAMMTIGSKTYNNEGYYYNQPSVFWSSSGSVYYTLPTGRTPCSAEVYFNAATALGYLVGFGNTQTRRMFSFTPSKFVGYNDDHNFQNSYSGKHHFVLTYDGNTTVKLYVDGVLAETISLSNFLDIGSSYFFQGRRATSTNELYTGDIYLTRIWNRELSSSEVSTLNQYKDF